MDPSIEKTRLCGIGKDDPPSKIKNDFLDIQGVQGGPASISEQNGPNIVTFDGPEDPLIPLNWSVKRKWNNIGLLSSMNLVIFLTGLTVASVTLDPSFLSDIFVVEERGKAMALANLAPLMGPLAGPVIGGYMSQKIGWRWTFWLPAILGVCVELGFVLMFRETHKVRIIQKKSQRLRMQTGNQALSSIYSEPKAAQIFSQALIRPLRLLIWSPVFILLALYVAIIFGLLYLLLTSITEAFTISYGFSNGKASLAFLGIGIGMTFGMIFCQGVLDHVVKKLGFENNQEPEHRLPPMIIGGFVVPLGLFLYGWTLHFSINCLVPIIGLALLGFGVIVTIIPAFSYLVDAFGIYAASAVAASITLRCVTGAILPLAGPSLYGTLGQGWGNSVLGFVAFALLPMPIMLMKFGRRLRKNAKFQIRL